MKKEKNFILSGEKGITLLALIITIIVMLILAGVSISMVVGEDGILSQAENATAQYSKAEIKEKVQMSSEFLYSGDNVGKVNLQKTKENIEKLNIPGITFDGSTDTELKVQYNGEELHEFKGTNGSAGGSSDINSQNLKIGGFVDLGISYTNVNGTVGYSSAHLTDSWNSNGPTGWRIISAGEKIVLVSAGSPLTYYTTKDTSNTTVSNMANLKTNISLVDTANGIEGFVKNGFSTNNLSQIFNHEYIESVRTFTVNDFINTYKYLSGKNTATIEDIYDDATSYPFKTSTLTSLSGNKMSDNLANDLLCNGFFYILNDKLVYESTGSSGEYANYMYDAAGSGYMRLDYGSGEFSVRPVVVLDKRVTISEGDGSIGNPYKIDTSAVVD